MGRHLVYSLVQERRHTDVIICLVREKKVECEQSYWDAHLSDLDESEQCIVKVLPYDMLDDGVTLKDALEAASTLSPSCKICVYHTASVFGPTEDPFHSAGHPNGNFKLKIVSIKYHALDCFHIVIVD